MRLIHIFLGLGLLWTGFGVYQIFSLSGDPNRWRSVGQAMAMAGLNLAVALFLNWRNDRRQRAGR